MNRSRILFLLLPLACSAQTIQGNVQNGTTGKPQREQQVVLFTASGEQGHAVTNDNGDFQLEPHTALSPHSPATLAVTHEGVVYFQAVRVAQRANVRVYEASQSASGISGYLSILQFQVKGRLLQVTELHAFSNASNPPITRVDPNNLVLSLPEGAHVGPATVSGPDGGTTKVLLVSIPGRTAQYRIDFPIKPGLTKYAISYDIPYGGNLAFRRQAQYPMRRIGVIVPETMRLDSLGAKLFHEIKDQSGTHELVLDNLPAHEMLAFDLSGAGELAHAFRPAIPGQPARPTGTNRLMSPPWPLRGSLGTSGEPTEVRTGFVGHYLTLAMGMFVLAGIVLRRMMLRRNGRI